MTKINCGVLYGNPKRFATSIDLYHFTKFFSDKFRLIQVIPDDDKFRLSRGIKRLCCNLIMPLSKLPNFNMIIYANDGFADINLIKRIKNLPVVLMWYDAFKNFVDLAVRPWKPVTCLRYNNVLKSDVVVGISDVLMDQAKKIRKDDNNVFYIPNGVDTAIFNPNMFNGKEIRDRYRISQDTIIIGYLGRIGGEGENFSARPLARIAKEILNNTLQKVIFMVVGFGPKLNIFKQYVRENNLENSFIFTGFIPYRKIPLYISCFDICVDTLDDIFLSYARCERKMKDYMSMGKPIVATGIGENIKDLDNGRTGLLAKSDNSDLAEKIIIYIRNKDLREQMGRKARERAVKHYDWRLLSFKLENITLETLKKFRRRK